MVRKKKVLIQTDFSLAKTGFGRNAKAILKYLFQTNKYDIVHYCCGLNWSNPETKKVPWKCFGSLPDSQAELEQLNRDPYAARQASYGANLLDKIIQQEKPDVYIAIQDIWGVDFAIDKPWFNKINSVIWTTLDSLPILDTAIKCASKIKNYWIWSNFATKEFHKLGYHNVKTVHGAIEDSYFYKLSEFERKNIRNKFGIPQDAFVIGYVFRNQLRKSVPNLLEGYALWKKQNPNIKNTFLLLHTHWSEGWNIHRLADEYGINKNEILTTYICKNCKNYEIKPFHGQDVDCRLCGAQKSQITTNVGLGVNESQLNEVYNIMDVYCHPFTSGGQEIPIQEAKLTELITLVTNYSCGEEMCDPEANSLTLDWAEYREHGTEFKKASTLPTSIAKQLNAVYNMPKDKKSVMGKKAREWTLKNFSLKYIGEILEKFLDEQELKDWSTINFSSEEKDPYAKIDDIQDSATWIKSLYAKILKRPEVDENDDGHKYWMQEISKGVKRIDIENYFRNVALQENLKSKEVKFEDFLDKDDEGRRLLYVMPEQETDIFLSTALFESIKKTYPNYNLYVSVKQEFNEILDGNKFIHKVIPYFPQMDNLLWLEGAGDHKGFFEIAFLPFVNSQRIVNFLHNGKTKINYITKE